MKAHKKNMFGVNGIRQKCCHILKDSQETIINDYNEDKAAEWMLQIRLYADDMHLAKASTKVQYILDTFMYIKKKKKSNWNLPEASTEV